MHEKKEFLKVTGSGSKLHFEGNVSVFIETTETGTKVGYIPSLMISVYGDNEAEIVEMAINSVRDFWDDMREAGEAKCFEELRRLGWEKKKLSSKQYVHAYVDKEGVLKNFDLPESTHLEEFPVEVA